MDQLLHSGWVQAGFAFLWGLSGYVVGYFAWRLATDKLSKMTDVLNHNTEVLRTLHDALNMAQRLDALKGEIRRVQQDGTAST